MPVFQPLAGTRAQIDARPVADGQFLVATDTGEVFVDLGGRRIAVAGSSGSGSSSGPSLDGSGDDDDDSPFFTSWPIAFASIRMSDSVSGGGPGAGVTDTPGLLFDADDAPGLDFAVANAFLLVSGSVPGGGPGNGILGAPGAAIPEIEDSLGTSYSITEET